MSVFQPFPSAINEDDLPIELFPGEILSITQVRFEYRGPERLLVLGVGFKPLGNLDFQDGQFLVDPYWNVAGIFVPRSETFTLIDQSINTQFPVPEPGLYQSTGNPSAGRNSVEVEFLTGLDTWVWLADNTKAINEDLFPSIDAIRMERYLIVIDTDSDVVDVQTSQAVRNLEVFYA